MQQQQQQQVAGKEGMIAKILLHNSVIQARRYKMCENLTAPFNEKNNISRKKAELGVPQSVRVFILNSCFALDKIKYFHHGRIKVLVSLMHFLIFAEQNRFKCQLPSFCAS